MPQIANILSCLIATQTFFKVSKCDPPLLTPSGNNLQCICIFKEKETQAMDDTIYSITKQFQILNFDVTNAKDMKSPPCQCSSYIVTISVKWIQKLFKKHFINLYFLPHKEVWLYVQNNATEVQKISKEPILIHDLHLTILEYKYSYQTNIRNIGREAIFSAPYVIQNKQKWDPVRLWKSFNQSLTVSVFECPPLVCLEEIANEIDGIDVKVLKEAFKGFPLEFHMLTAEDGNYLFTEAQNLVLSNERSIAACGQWLQDIPLDQSITYIHTCRNVLVPRARLLSDFTFVFQMLRSDVWLLSFITLFISTLTIRVMLKVLEPRSTATFSSILLFAIRGFSMGSISGRSYTKHFSVRIFMSSFFLFCTLISTYYSAGLTISLRFPRFYPEINTLEDIINAGLHWFEGSTFVKQWLMDADNQKYSELAKLYIQRPNSSELNRFLSKGDYATFVNKFSSNDQYLMFSESLDENARKTLKIVYEDVFCLYSVFPLERNSPLVDILNKKLANLIVGGFINYWLHMFTSKKENQFMINFFKRYSVELHQQIDLNKFLGAFYLLFVGYLSGFLCLCFELITIKLKRKVKLYHK